MTHTIVMVDSIITKVERLNVRRHLDRINLGWSMLLLGTLTAVTALLASPTAAMIFAVGVVMVVLAAVVVVRPAVTLALLVVGEFTNVAVVLKDAIPGSIQTGIFALGTASVLLAVRHPQMRDRLRRPVLTPLVLFVLYLLSLVPAIISTASRESTALVLAASLKDAVFLGLVLLLTHIVNAPWWVAKLMVAPLAVLAALTVLNQFLLGNSTSFGGFANVSASLGELTTTARHAGPTQDPNFWGRNLLIGLPFAYALVQRSVEKYQVRSIVGWSLSTVAIWLGIYLTQSRGAVIATAVLTGVWVLAAGPAVRRVGLLLSPLGALLILIPGVGDRLLTLSQFEGSSADLSLVGRVAAQEMGLAMFGDHPLFGVGPGAFSSLTYAYGSRSAAAQHVIGPLIDAPHDLYLQIAAESGLIGVAGWSVLIVGVAAMATRSMVRLVHVRAAGSHEGANRVLAAAALTSIVGWSVASVFLHQAYVRELLVVFALTALIYAQSRATPRPNAEVRATLRADVRHAARRSAVLLVGAAVVIGGAISVLLAATRTSYVAQRTLSLQAQPSDVEGYALNVRARTAVVPTLAALIAPGRPNVTVTGDPTSGVVTMVGKGDTPQQAVRLVQRAAQQASAGLRRPGVEPGYSVISISDDVVRAERVYQAAAVWWALACGALTLVVVVFAARRSRLWSGARPVGADDRGRVRVQ